VATAPFAPWALAGECLAGLARWRGPSSGRAPLPQGLRRLPGPCLIVGVRYTDSPVGPYLELAIGEPARVGARPGFCITTMVVDSPASRAGGRLNWGFPKELGTLRWRHRDDEPELCWDERGIVVRGLPRGPTLPVLVPVRSLQHRGDGPVVVPGSLRGRARLARVTVEAPEDDPLAALAGNHRGGVVQGMHFVVRPARHPIGLTSTLMAPLRPAEPALSLPPMGE
jgi:hypothetical protein